MVFWLGRWGEVGRVTSWALDKPTYQILASYNAFEKFLVGGHRWWWWWVVEGKFSVQLRPKLNTKSRELKWHSSIIKSFASKLHNYVGGKSNFSQNLIFWPPRAIQILVYLYNTSSHSRHHIFHTHYTTSSLETAWQPRKWRKEWQDEVLGV